MKRFEMSNPLDRIFSYCDICEAKIPPDEYDENDGLCEVCQMKKYKLTLEIECEEPTDMLVDEILEGSWLYSQDNETMVVTNVKFEKVK